MLSPPSEPVLLKSALPEFSKELERLLERKSKPVLAAQVPSLVIVDRCRCEDDFCATFYTQPKPNGAYGPTHDCLEVEPERGMIILDVLNGEIACVEVLYRDEVRAALLAIFP